MIKERNNPYASEAIKVLFKESQETYGEEKTYIEEGYEVPQFVVGYNNELRLRNWQSIKRLRQAKIYESPMKIAQRVFGKDADTMRAIEIELLVRNNEGVLNGKY